MNHPLTTLKEKTSLAPSLNGRGIRHVIEPRASARWDVHSRNEYQQYELDHSGSIRKHSVVRAAAFDRDFAGLFRQSLRRDRKHSDAGGSAVLSDRDLHDDGLRGAVGVVVSVVKWSDRVRCIVRTLDCLSPI